MQQELKIAFAVLAVLSLWTLGSAIGDYIVARFWLSKLERASSSMRVETRRAELQRKYLQSTKLESHERLETMATKPRSEAECERKYSTKSEHVITACVKGSILVVKINTKTNVWTPLHSEPYPN